MIGVLAPTAVGGYDCLKPPWPGLVASASQGWGELGWDAAAHGAGQAGLPLQIGEVYALRDDVKPFVRSYFNTIAAMLNPEVLSFWEHFNHSGAWDKTHETGYFLHQTRTMLVTERGDQLWLADGTRPNSWCCACAIRTGNASGASRSTANRIATSILSASASF